MRFRKSSELFWVTPKRLAVHSVEFILARRPGMRATLWPISRGEFGCLRLVWTCLHASMQTNQSSRSSALLKQYAQCILRRTVGPASGCDHACRACLFPKLCRCAGLPFRHRGFSRAFVSWHCGPWHPDLPSRTHSDGLSRAVRGQSGVHFAPRAAREGLLPAKAVPKPPLRIAGRATSSAAVVPRALPLFNMTGITYRR